MTTKITIKQGKTLQAAIPKIRELFVTLSLIEDEVFKAFDDANKEWNEAKRLTASFKRIEDSISGLANQINNIPVPLGTFTEIK